VIHYRNMALALRMQQTTDLSALPAVVEDVLVEMIKARDPAAVGHTENVDRWEFYRNS